MRDTCRGRTVRRPRGPRARRGLWLAMLIAVRAMAETFHIPVPGGYSIAVDVSHVAPDGELVTPNAPVAPPFKPPTIYSAPLPSGSGARALGQGGAFTATADDATAASWNPGGLLQLERTEASFVLRSSWERNEHRSGADDYRVGTDSFDSQSLNYLSMVCPFRWGTHNWVFSANYQEAYDFTQRFRADALDQPIASQSGESEEVFRDTTVQHYDDGIVDVDVTSRLKTRQTSRYDQVLTSQALTGLEFEQEGVLDAFTYAFAAEVTPRLAIGAAANFYYDGCFGRDPIRSRTRASYGGTARSDVTIHDRRVTTGTYTYEGVLHLPPGGIVQVPIDVPVENAGEYPAFEDEQTRVTASTLEFDGLYEESNQFEDMEGINGTLGVLWTVSRHLGVGFTADLPWTAKGSQTRTVRNTIVTYDEGRRSVLDTTATEETVRKDVAFEFPAYLAAGAVWRWTPSLFTAIDVSRTLWSDFSFQAKGEEKINPLDGSPYGLHPIEDCWAVRLGAEYLCLLNWTEIPVRGGLAWEERPAVGAPDNYWSASLGTGLSLGRDEQRMILDVAYVYTRGEDVIASLVPDQPGLRTDVERHQVYVSGIWHF